MAAIRANCNGSGLSVEDPYTASRPLKDCNLAAQLEVPREPIEVDRHVRGEGVRDCSSSDVPNAGALKHFGGVNTSAVNVSVTPLRPSRRT